jgi:predicted nucleic-acid-binding Zn-ribbon protein
MADTSTPCPECGKSNLYRSVQMSAGGGHAPNYLPGLGTFFTGAKFQVIVCRDCGLTRFYADREARGRLAESKKWTRA